MLKESSAVPCHSRDIQVQERVGAADLSIPRGGEIAVHKVRAQ